MTIVEKPQSEDEAQAMLRALVRYYKEPVMPMSKYCAAFITWSHAIESNREDFIGEFGNEAMLEIANIAPLIQTAIMKSSLLSRLLYAGQELRTEKCALHKGHWAGLYSERPNLASLGITEECTCWDGWEASGWVPIVKQEIPPSET